MTINRFDQPAQAQFINTYVPIPFEELSQAVQMRQTKHEQGLNALDQLEAEVLNIKAIPTNPNQVALKNELVTKFEGLLDKYSKEDLSDLEINRAIKADIRRNLPKETISYLENNYSMWEQNTQVKRELMAKGLYNPELDEDPASDPTWGAAGETYDYMVSPYKPKEEELINYMAMLKEPDFKSYDPETGMLVHGRNQKDLDQVIGQYASQYEKTLSGQNEIKLFKQAFPDQAAEMTDTEIAAQVMNDFGQQFIRDEVRVVGGSSRSGGKGTFSGLSGAFNVAATEGADVAKTSPRNLEKERESTTKEIEQLNKQLESEELSEDEKTSLQFTKTELQSRQAEIAEVLDTGRKIAEDLFNERTNNIETAVKQQVSSIRNLDDKSKEIALDIFNKHLELNKQKEIQKEVSISPAGGYGYGLATASTETPGAGELYAELMQKGFTPPEANRVRKAYTKFFRQSADARKSAENVYDDYVREEAGNLYSGEIMTNYPYQKEKDQLVFNNAFSNESQLSYVNSILDTANDRPELFKIEALPGERSLTVRKWLKGIADNKFSINNANVRYTLTDEGDISFKADVHEKQKNGDLGKKQGEIDLMLNHPTQKQALVNELFDMGNFRGAFANSEMAWSIDNTVKYKLSEDNPLTIPVPVTADTNIYVKQNGSEYTIAILDGEGNFKTTQDGQGEPITVRGKDNVKDAIKKYIYSSIVPNEQVGPIVNGQFFPFPLDPNFSWTD